MNDYTLYLVKRAHYKKQLMRKLAGSPVYQIDPIEIYNNALQDAADAVKYTNDNKIRMREEGKIQGAKTGHILGGVGGGLAGAAGGAGYHAIRGWLDPDQKGWGNFAIRTLTPAALMAAAGTGYGHYAGGKAGYAKGEEAGRKKDVEAYRKNVTKAKNDFNLKHTGKLHPSRMEIMKAGNEIYESL